MSVRPSAWNISAPTGRIFMKFDTGRSCWTCSEDSDLVELTDATGHEEWRAYTTALVTNFTKISTVYVVTMVTGVTADFSLPWLYWLPLWHVLLVTLLTWSPNESSRSALCGWHSYLAMTETYCSLWVWAEVEETAEHGAYRATYHSQTAASL